VRLALFVVTVPVVELVVGPWALTGFDVGDDLPAALQPVGAVLIALALVVLADAYARFAREGQGTPSPLAPPRRLVVSGAYRWVRHPMYIATTVALVGEAFLLRRAVLLVAALAYGVALAALAHWWEEPLLRKRFREYDQR
jgi:protein-S-isoprenylcysteine O-methyltransferase Ste14